MTEITAVKLIIIQKCLAIPGNMVYNYNDNHYSER